MSSVAGAATDMVAALVARPAARAAAAEEGGICGVREHVQGTDRSTVTVRRQLVVVIRSGVIAVQFLTTTTIPAALVTGARAIVTIAALAVRVRNQR